MKYFTKTAAENKKRKLSSTARGLLSGFGGGTASALVTMPLNNVIDYRKQFSKNAPKFFTTVKDLYRTGGPKRFFQDAGPAVFKVGLGMGVAFGTSEYFKNLLTKIDKINDTQGINRKI